MTAERPYFSASIGDLENLFAAGKEDAPLLNKLAAELKCRKRPRARRLHAEVMDALAKARAKNYARAAPQACAGCGNPENHPAAGRINLEKQTAADAIKEPALSRSKPEAKKSLWRRLLPECGAKPKNG